MAEASYPDDLLYHAEHDWARVDGGQATLGITWYAQDALGEVVFFEPPAAGVEVRKDAPYAERVLCEPGDAQRGLPAVHTRPIVLGVVEQIVGIAGLSHSWLLFGRAAFP